MKFLYYLIQWTWGLPMNIIGAITYIICNCFGYKSYWFRNARCIVHPKNFGGVELGMFFVRGEKNTSVCEHEYGHSIQNLWWGPLFPFVIAIPSAFRYWMRNQPTQKDKQSFAIFIGSIVLIVLAALFSISLAFSIVWLNILTTVLILYFIAIESWMLGTEIPKYEKGLVRYDDVWFEGQATKLGQTAKEGKWTWL